YGISASPLPLTCFIRSSWMIAARRSGNLPCSWEWYCSRNANRCGCSAASYLRVCGQRLRKRKGKRYPCGISQRNWRRCHARIKHCLRQQPQHETVDEQEDRTLRFEGTAESDNTYNGVRRGIRPAPQVETGRREGPRRHCSWRAKGREAQDRHGGLPVHGNAERGPDRGGIPGGL